jgi:hypothetical protein
MTKSFTTLTAAAAVLLAAGAANAADLRSKGKIVEAPPAPSMFDIAFGAALASDYNFRGISQSDRGPSASVYFEPRWNFAPNWQLYGGIAGASVDLPTDPSAEVDFYGGIRPTFGPLAFDLGYIYYYYPNETQHVNNPATPGVPVPGAQSWFDNGNTTLKNTDFWEVYGKVAYTFFNDKVIAGANLYYSDSYLNTGADGTYVSGTLKVLMPNLTPAIGWFVSGEYGHYTLGNTKVDFAVWNTSPTGSISLPDYSYWNAGVGFTYKAFTLDLRYHDTDLSKGECNILTGDPGAVVGGAAIDPVRNSAGNASKWCGGAFIAKLSVDLTLDSLK